MKPKVIDRIVLAYGLLLIALGLFAFLKDGSVMSLIGGGGSGVVVLAFLAITAKKRQIGRIGVAVVSLALLGMFGPKSIKYLSTPPVDGKPYWHIFVIAVLSLIAFVTLGLGHMAAMRERRLE